MNHLDRRAFLGVSAGAVAALSQPETALAQTACVTGPLAPFMPSRLTVDCASRRNFLIFRRNPTYMGLTGVVSMSYVRGKWGAYTAGNLFLFPWLKQAGLALGTAKDWQTVLPTSATAFRVAGPIRGWTSPLDEYFCRYLLEAPYATFIGVRVDDPFKRKGTWAPWYSDVDKLADGKPIGINWNSDNLNAPWFGGSQNIANTATCNGSSWRKLIVDGLNQASVGMC